ncbi:hypothetical protein, variant [Verruconis gallopava]|uniref:Hybrid signal transduction histidine kinase K n=1 Tax=Verruconis gallopava TaxID=253628 RepID=A0A0D2AQ57_9PEZI|nr:hypothetical protein, variant [Verruconis gallopava]KIW08818.1 hypothetical protein, variant [Verruconis gallopava]
MTNPKSIFTAPEEFLPASRQSAIKSPSRRVASANSPPTSPSREAPPQLNKGEGKRQHGTVAWTQALATEPPLAPGPSTTVAASGSDRTDFVPPPAQLAGVKRTYDKVTQPDDTSSQRQQPQHKKSRLERVHQIGSLELPRPQLQQQAPPGHPPSPLFFSNTSNARPPLPPRFSSGEAAERMLRQADAEEAKVKTVKLARVPYNGSSPPGIGLVSYRSTPSALQDEGSPEAEDSRAQSSLLLSQVGVAELLEQDSRPTLIIDLSDAANYAPGVLRIIFANSSLRSNPALYEAVRGRPSAVSPKADPAKSFALFQAWITSAAINGESLDVALPPFVHGGVSWSCSTLRKRLRVASASAAISTPHSTGPASTASQHTRISSGDANPTTSTGSIQKTLQEPADYFGNAVPETQEPTTKPEPSSEEVPPALPSTELQEASSSARETTHETSQSEPLPLNGAQTIAPSEILSLGSHPSLTNDPSQEDIGFFDWTRLPYSENLPRHIKFARSVDWASTSLGPIELWPPDLRQMCNLIMASPHPAAMYWGDDLVAIYNEAYVLLAGQKHPKLMGQSYSEAWAEIWDEVKDVFANARQTGQATMKDDDCLFIKRSNFLEETYFSWSIIPMVGVDGTVTGLYNPAFEKTRRKIVERRMLTLREVGERTATARDVKGFWKAVGDALEINPMDTPFVLLYSVSEESDSDSSSIHSSSIIGTKQCYLENALGIPKHHPVAPEQIDLKNSMEGFGPVFREVMKTDKPVLLRVAGTEEDEPVLGAEYDGQVLGHEVVIEKGPEISASMLEGIDWRGFGDPCRSVVICPVHPTTGESILGFLVLGVNPRRPYDDDYALFVQLLSRQLATSLASVVLFEEEIRRGQRAAKLAALDRIELSEQLAARTQEARDSETRFARMAELSPAALFIANSQGQIIFCNEAWYEITRVPKDSTSTDRWIDAVSETDQPRVRQLWFDLVENCKAFTAEVRFKAQWHDRHGTTTDTWVLFSAFPETYSEAIVAGPKGKLKSVFGSLTDISQQKWAESFQKRKMEEAVELKRQQENFIDITSHEMRNPLSAILQCADEIKTRLSEFKESQATEIEQTLVDDSIEAAQTIMFCAQHQKQIVDDVLTLSKLDSHMLMVTPIDVQPVSVVERALKMHENEIKSADITMRFVVDESYKALGIDWVRFDPQRVLQVLINLTGNAIKFTAGRETRIITVTIAASEEKPSGHNQLVEYFPSRKNETELSSSVASADWGTGKDVYIQFAVQDTGRGLNMEEKKMLFMRFSQASPRTHIQYGGSGLGLFISRELSELQGGEIGVASEAGRGSTFGFYVRARRSAKPTDTESQFPELVKSLTAETKTKRSGSVRSKDTMKGSKQAGRENIVLLIVEDNLVNQKVLQKQLKNVGFKVNVANHGGECLEQLKKSQFWKDKNGQGEPLNVVLMDQEMPVMDGLECTKRIREWEKDGSLARHVPIIGVTANARAEQIETLLVAGMDDVVSKPFRIPEIVPKIEEICEKFSAQTDGQSVAASSG